MFEKLKTVKEKSFLKRNLPALIIAAVGMVIYLNTLYHDYVLDDITVTSRNHLVQQGIKGIPEILKTSYWFGYDGAKDLGYRPLSLVMFAVEWQLSPANPHFNHLVSIILYGATGFLLFVTLRRLFEGYSVMIPFSIALLYIAHPVHTEVVANIKSRDEMLSFFFSIAAIYFLLSYIRKTETRSKKQEARSLFYSGLCFFLALISKENVVTMVAVIPLVIYFFSDVPLKKNLQTTMVFVAIVVGYIALRQILPEGFTFRKSIPLPDNTLVAAPDMMSRLATATNILGRYLIILLIPHPLISDYSFSHIPVVGWSNWGALASLAVHLFLVVYAIRNFRKKDLLVFGILFYLITFSIVSNVLFLVGATLAERFMYLPSLGFFITIVILASRLLKLESFRKTDENLLQQAKSNVKFAALIFVVFFLYSFKTISRNNYWKNNLTLFSNDLKSAPNSCKLNFYYAVSLLETAGLEAPSSNADQQNKVRMAIAALEKTLSITKNFVQAYEQLGYAYYLQGLFEKAKETYELALQNGLHSDRLFNNYGVACMETREYDKAFDLMNKAIEHNPNNNDAYNNIGGMFNKTGRYREAIPYLEKAIKLNPRYTVAYKNIARSWANIKDYDMAIVNLNKAMELSPYDYEIYLYLGYSYKYKNDLTTSQRYFDKSDELKRSSAK